MDDHTRDPTVDPPPPGQNPTGWLPEENRWEHDTLRRAVIHGVRLFNSGEYHDSHDCFEDEWFNYGNGTLEKKFLQGMVQVAAGAYKATVRENESGLRKLFTTGRGYLSDVPADFYGIDVDGVRDAVESTLAEPTEFDEWTITLDGETPKARPEDEDFAKALP